MGLLLQDPSPYGTHSSSNCASPGRGLARFMSPLTECEKCGPGRVSDIPILIRSQDTPFPSPTLKSAVTEEVGGGGGAQGQMPPGAKATNQVGKLMPEYLRTL